MKILQECKDTQIAKANKKYIPLIYDNNNKN